MGDLHIFPAPELTDRVAPALHTSAQNAGSAESESWQTQPHFWHAAKFDFQPVRDLDSHSPGMVAFNMIRAFFCEAAMSQPL